MRGVTEVLEQPRRDARACRQSGFCADAGSLRYPRRQADLASRRACPSPVPTVYLRPASALYVSVHCCPRPDQRPADPEHSVQTRRDSERRARAETAGAGR